MSSMASVCKKYGCSLDYLHYLFHSLIKSPFTYGISVLGTVTFEKYLSLELINFTKEHAV